MAIKRNITDISTLKRGANTLSAVYRGTSLIWPSNPPAPVVWMIDTWTNGVTGFTSPQPTTIDTWVNGVTGFEQQKFI